VSTKLKGADVDDIPKEICPKTLEAVISTYVMVSVGGSDIMWC
jgi:hypothetical protein